MISLSTVVGLLFLHLIADFFLQSDWMALNKSKRWDALFVHVFVYSFVFLLFFPLEFVLITFVTHALTDAITSRITSWLWFIELQTRPTGQYQERYFPFYAHIELHKRHWFFVAIGVDQFIHYVTLLYTYKWVFGA